MPIQLKRMDRRLIGIQLNKSNMRKVNGVSSFLRIQMIQVNEYGRVLIKQSQDVNMPIYQRKTGIMMCTDQDYPGERVRQIIERAVPECKHAFLTKEQARAKLPTNKSLGIEHASLAAIQQALSAVYELGEVETSDICRQDL